LPPPQHLLLSPLEGKGIATAIQVLKQRFSRTRTDEFVWEPRYHDFNVFTDAKRIEKLRYMHRNPIKAGLVESPEDWPWSSFNAYATNQPQPVQITKYAS
jgi:putative transposase